MPRIYPYYSFREYLCDFRGLDAVTKTRKVTKKSQTENRNFCVTLNLKRKIRKLSWQLHLMLDVSVNKIRHEN